MQKRAMIALISRMLKSSVDICFYSRKKELFDSLLSLSPRFPAEKIPKKSLLVMSFPEKSHFCSKQFYLARNFDLIHSVQVTGNSSHDVDTPGWI